MEVTHFIINIGTDDEDRLRKFYTETVGLTPNPDMGPGAFNLTPGTTLAIAGHDKVHGMAKEPDRMLIDFMVTDLKAEQERLKAKGVEFVREEGKEEWGGIISTFLDPDGNYCQLIEWNQAGA